MISRRGDNDSHPARISGGSDALGPYNLRSVHCRCVREGEFSIVIVVAITLLPGEDYADRPIGCDFG